MSEKTEGYVSLNLIQDQIQALSRHQFMTFQDIIALTAKIKQLENI